MPFSFEYRLLLFIFSLSIVFRSNVSAQHSTLLDSLEHIYTNGLFDAVQKPILLAKLAIEHKADSRKKLLYSRELINLANDLNSIEHLITGYAEQGHAHVDLGNMHEALKSYITVAEYASNNDKREKLGGAYICIAQVLSVIDNHNEAIQYYNDAIHILEQENDSVNLASACLNLGDEYFNIARLDSALHYTLRAEELFSLLNHNLGLAFCLGNKGMVYAKMNRDHDAEVEMNKAIQLMENLGVYDPITTYLIHISDIYFNAGDNNSALTYASRSLNIATEEGLKDQISEASLQLYKIFEKTNNFILALGHYKQHILYRDSVSNVASIQKIADVRSDFEIAQKQLEVDLLTQEKKIKQQESNAMKIISGLLVVFLLTLFWFYKSVSREKKRADKLLLNILPLETARELKRTGKVKARRFESASILFTDFKGFTRYSSTLSPEDLVETIDLYFSKFDELVEKYKLEKIKTIGDAYMCSGGLPFVTDDHAVKIVRLGLEMLEFTRAELELEKLGNRFDIRIGINTGPVVAGVVGFKKFAYDIWGDSVNIASRMESNSIAGRLNISNNTYELVKDHFNCEYRGKINVKNKGPMDMYFVNGLIGAN